MTKQMKCWKCGGEMSVTSDMIGASARCPHCETAVSVPGELFDSPVARPAGFAQHAHAVQKSPSGAAILNFLFWGGGYVYLGRMWGLWILIPFCMLTGIACIAGLEGDPADVSIGGMILGNLPGVAMAFHAYHIAQEGR